MALSRSDLAFVAPPDPGRAGSLDEVVEALRLLKVWAGDLSYEAIKDRVNAQWRAAGLPGGEQAKRATVADCFRPGRRRLNTDLVIAVVQSLHPDVGYVAQWRQALRVVGGEARRASQVRVQDTLPQDLAGFTGRAAELGRLRAGGTVLISGMAGVGKTQLAIHAGHLLARERPFDRVLFVDLRGFHPDPTQPPAEPAAVLDGFLRLLGVPGQNIPHDVQARTTAYRDRLAGRRVLVVLDNAAGEDQVRPLLPATPGCLTLITSRRNLADLHAVTRLTVDVFTPDEARRFLALAAPRVPVGGDADAPARIAHRCGYLPLALGLVAGHIRGTPGWTLTDHADRLDQRHHDQRPDTGVELALDLSYQHLSAARQRLLRLAALHPGQGLDAYAAAALTGADLSAVRADLDDLHRDHLLQQSAPGRYAFHDLVRGYATGRAGDQDPPSGRRAALTRLFDYYLAGAAAAMDTLYPAEAYHRPRITAPGIVIPELTDPDAALGWLDTERPTLVAVAAHAATRGWPSHTIRLSTIVYRYLDGGYPAEALSIHGHADRAADHPSDPDGQAHALNGLGTAYLRMGRYEPAAEHLRRALRLFRRTGDPAGQARVLGNLGNIEKRLGRYGAAIDYHERALQLFRRAGDQAGQARSLCNLGVVETRLGRHRSATDHLRQALVLCRQAGDRTGEADTFAGLGEVERRQGRYQQAAEHVEQALAGYRQLGDRASEAAILDDLGSVLTRLGRPERAAEHHRQSLLAFREAGDRDGEAWALNGLGEAAYGAGSPADALSHHDAAHTVATEVGSRDQQARAHVGRAHAYDALDQRDRARQHYAQALDFYAELGLPEAEQIRLRLVTMGNDGARRSPCEVGAAGSESGACYS